MTTSIIHALDNFGLSEKEVSVYLAVLELGKATATYIAKAAEVNRATTYVALETLESHGLIASVSIGKKRYFVPENPHQLITKAQENKHQWESRLKEISAVLPDLDALYQSSPSKPQVRFYEGKRGLKTVFSDTLATPNTTLLIYADIGASTAALGDYFDRYYIPARQKRRIKVKVIFADSPQARERVKRNAAELREARLAAIDIQNEIIIYQDKVAILSFTQPQIGIIIQNAEITATQRAIFNLSWEAVGRAASALAIMEPTPIPLS